MNATAKKTMAASMRRFWFALAIALLAAAPALALRFTATHLPALPTVAFAGVSILAAGFMLSWAVEAAEQHVSRGPALAVLALITVLPEFVVDFYYAMRGGQAPDSEYVHYAAANMTGANRLLVGFGWPVIVMLYWWKSGRRAVELAAAGICLGRGPSDRAAARAAATGGVVPDRGAVTVRGDAVATAPTRRRGRGRAVGVVPGAGRRRLRDATR